MKGLLFTYALTYGGAVASLFNPWYGLLIYVCFAIIKPEALWHWSVPQGNYSRIIALALLVGWAMNGLGNWRLGRATSILLALIGFWLWVLVCTLVCSNPELGYEFLESLGKIVLPFVVGLTVITSVRQLRQLAWVIMLSQGYVAFDLNMSYFDGYNRLQEYGFAGLDNNSACIALVTATGLAFFLGIYERQGWKKLIAFACAALLAHAVFFSYSRGGMLALCVVGGMTFWLIPKTPKHYGLFALGVVAALIMAGPSVRDRFQTVFADKEERDYSAQSRVDLWKACLDIAATHPVTGVGPDHFPLMADKYGFHKGKEAHTLWLQTAAELGFPGLALLAGFYLLTIQRTWRLLKSRNEHLVNAARMTIASLVGFVVAAQFVSLEGLEIPYYVALLGAAAVKLYDSHASSEAAERFQSTSNPLFALQ